MLSTLPLGTIAIARRLFAMTLRVRRQVAGSQHLDELACGRRQLPPALIDDRSWAREGTFLELAHLQRSSRHLVLDRQAWNDRASEAYLLRTLDALDVVEPDGIQRLHAIIV